jgi:transposase
MARNHRLVGIDVSKEKVDACIRSSSVRKAFASSDEGRGELIAWLREHRVSKAVMEASGGYERSWTKALCKAGIEVRVVDPKRVRYFARSAGQIAKNDPIDAEMIAWFAETFPRAQGKAPDPEREELASLVSARAALIEVQTDIGNRGEHEQPALVRKAHQAVLKAVSAQLARLDAAIAAKLKTTASLAEPAEIIESVPGLATSTAACLVALMPELGRVHNKTAASLLGAAPYDEDSGKHTGKRHIKGGRQKLRTLFYMPVLGAATRHNPVLKAHYLQLRARGKEPKVALVACMRKLIVILNTMIARGEKWDPTRHALA